MKYVILISIALWILFYWWDSKLAIVAAIATGAIMTVLGLAWRIKEMFGGRL